MFECGSKKGGGGGGKSLFFLSLSVCLCVRYRVRDLTSAKQKVSAHKQIKKHQVSGKERREKEYEHENDLRLMKSFFLVQWGKPCLLYIYCVYSIYIVQSCTRKKKGGGKENLLSRGLPPHLLSTNGFEWW